MRAEPDGATIGVSIVGPLALNTLLFSRLSYDPFSELALISRIVDQPSVLVVNAEVPARNGHPLNADVGQRFLHGLQLRRLDQGKH